VRSTIERHRGHYGLRDHEIDRAVKLGADLWKGQTDLGTATEHAATAIKQGH
jgi:hypothetical protein